MVIYIAGSIPLFRGKRSNHFRLQRQSKHGAAHLHRDEETPHIHVTLVPIVKGERKRRKREEQTKKRYRKKPTDTVRLCADDIMTRLKLKSYQDTYAVAMAKYGLQRGIDGSKARHKSTQQYYRDIQKLADNLKAEVVDLQQQKETAREELRRAKKGDTDREAEKGGNHRSRQHRQERRLSFREQQGQDIGKGEHRPA